VRLEREQDERVESGEGASERNDLEFVPQLCLSPLGCQDLLGRQCWRSRRLLHCWLRLWLWLRLRLRLRRFRWLCGCYLLLHLHHLGRTSIKLTGSRSRSRSGRFCAEFARDRIDIVLLCKRRVESGQEGEHSKGAIFLILGESPAQVVRISALLGDAALEVGDACEGVLGRCERGCDSDDDDGEGAGEVGEIGASRR